MSSQIRKLTYGYKICQGEVVTNPSEAVEVKKVFMKYLGGESYQKIADNLTIRNVEYLPNKTNWNKGRVKRILENEKYTGTTSLPPIISEQEFYRVQKIISSKTNSTVAEQMDLSILKNHIKCADCGSKLRKYKYKDKIFWRCTCQVDIDLNILLSEVDRLLDICKNLESFIDESAHTTNEEIAFIKSAINTEMSAEYLDSDKINKLIKSYALAQYQTIPADYSSYSDKINAALTDKQANPLEQIVSITRNLSVSSHSKLAATLITYKEI